MRRGEIGTLVTACICQSSCVDVHMSIFQTKLTLASFLVQEDFEEAISVLQACQDDYHSATAPG